jgi:hypothetical protein
MIIIVVAACLAFAVIGKSVSSKCSPGSGKREDDVEGGVAM